MKKIKLNNETCIGCGACTAVCSEVFEFDEEGYAKVIENKENFESLEEEIKEEVVDAVEGCPVSAISIEEVTENKENNNSVEKKEN